MEIDDFVRDNVFNHIPARYLEDGVLDYDEVWWRECVGDLEGYILVWANGESHHTYRYPPNLYS